LKKRGKERSEEIGLWIVFAKGFFGRGIVDKRCTECNDKTETETGEGGGGFNKKMCQRWRIV